MYKKLLYTGLIGISLLTGIAACGKKDGDSAPAAPAPTSSTNDTVYAAAPTNVEIGSGVDTQKAQTVLSILKTQVPQVNVTNLDNSPVPGFYQLLADGEVLYVSDNGNFMFVGDVYDVKQSARESLTENVRKQARLAVLNTIPESDMVVYTPTSGTIEHTVTVFTDIDCGYCRKFHTEMNDYLAKNIKVRYLAFPRAGLGSDSYKKAQTVWCSDNRQKAMDSAKLTNDFKAADKLCDSKVIDNSMELVRKIGLRGTPALILEDGTLLPGYMPADRLKATLDSNKNRALSGMNGASAG